MTAHEFEPKHLPILIRTELVTVYTDVGSMRVDMYSSNGRVWLWGRALSASDYARGWALISEYRP